MKLISDTREQTPLVFTSVQGVEVIRQGMPVGDYTALHTAHGVEQLETVVFERKSLADLFHSFTAEYEREKEKWRRAKESGLTYILAIEGSISDILKGHAYWGGQELKESKKSGLAMIRQLCTIQRKYAIQVMYFTSRKEMAFYLQEYFLAQERAM